MSETPPANPYEKVANMIDSAPIFGSPAPDAAQGLDADALRDPPPAAAKGKRKPTKPTAPKEHFDAPTGGVGGEDVIWPPGFTMNARGLWFGEEDNLKWISRSFSVDGLCRTEDRSGWGVIVSFRDLDGCLQTEVIPWSRLQGDGASEVRARLADVGLVISPSPAVKGRLVQALAGIDTGLRCLLVPRSGWHKDGKIFALPHTQIAAVQSERVVFDKHNRDVHFGFSGDLIAWREKVASLARHQDRLVFALALAFSGPLLDPLGLSGGGFHYFGKSSIGKTTAFLLAGSVWGGSAGDLGFGHSWNATGNSLEGLAAAHNDSLLLLDEIKMVEPRDLDAAVYALAGGVGKGRMRSDAELRERRRWRISILSTGEMTIAARIAEGGVNSRIQGGQEVRLIDLPADAGCGFGIFNNPGDWEPGELTEAIRAATSAYYGVAGLAFLEQLVKRRADIASDARRRLESFVGDVIPTWASGQVLRVARRFGLVASAGEIACSLGILPFEANEVRDAASRLFNVWLAGRGGARSSEANAAIIAVRSFIQLHGLARFVDVSRDTEGSWRQQMLAGYKRLDRGLYLFHDAGWREATQGLDAFSAADALAEAGFLEKDPSGKRKLKIRIFGEQQRLYAVKASILQGADDSDVAPPPFRDLNDDPTGGDRADGGPNNGDDHGQ